MLSSWPDAKRQVRWCARPIVRYRYSVYPGCGRSSATYSPAAGSLQMKGQVGRLILQDGGWRGTVHLYSRNTDKYSTQDCTLVQSDCTVHWSAVWSVSGQYLTLIVCVMETHSPSTVKREGYCANLSLTTLHCTVLLWSMLVKTRNKKQRQNLCLSACGQPPAIVGRELNNQHREPYHSLASA